MRTVLTIQVEGLVVSILTIQIEDLVISSWQSGSKVWPMRS